MDKETSLVFQASVLALINRICNLERNQDRLLLMIEAQNQTIERMAERIC